MALRAVPDHPKFAHLKALLNLGKGATLGYLECVWHFAARFTPRGNIGKYADTAVESWVEWDGEPGALINALVETRWLERNETFRLVVHDWAQHADDAVNTTLARNCEMFWDGTLPKTGRLNQHERERFRQRSAGDQPAISHESASLLIKPASAPKPEPEPEPEPVFPRTPTAADDVELGTEPFNLTDGELSEVWKANGYSSIEAMQERWFDDEFWPGFWRKVDRADALKAFKKHAKTETAKNLIIEAEKAHAPYYLSRNPEHRPYAATWLNKRRYEEAPEDPRPPAKDPPKVQIDSHRFDENGNPRRFM